MLVASESLHATDTMTSIDEVFVETFFPVETLSEAFVVNFLAALVPNYTHEYLTADLAYSVIPQFMIRVSTKGLPE